MAAVLLIVPPFHTTSAPAIGLSLLKAALIRDGIRCEVLYLNLRFAELAGPGLYASIEEGPAYEALVGEWIFAGDLFGDRAPDPRSYVDEILRARLGSRVDRTFIDRVQELRLEAPAFLERVMDRVVWEDYAVVGVSSTFQQNCAGLAVLRRVKARYPGIRTVMGGANCEGAMGAAIHELFPFVDYVCSGEGDLVFPLLVRKILAEESTHGLPGLLARGGPNLSADKIHAPLVLDLDRLPYPDYDDYFVQLMTTPVGPETRPVLPFETSRGCWWGEKHHCTFCGLNGGGMRYRHKSPRRALEELDFLVGRHGVRDVQAVDNILDLGYLDTFLKELADRPLPPRIFYETKANLTKEQLRRLARAGVRHLQAGIESLSTPILRLMDKGVTALQNVRLLKWCAEIGIVPGWNLLYGFPGEDAGEYWRMADLVASLTHLQPPYAVAQIWLDRYSPNFVEAGVRGFVNLRAEAPYRHVYPFRTEDLDRLAYHFEYDYADGRDPEQYTGALRRAVGDWRERGGPARLQVRVDDDRLEIEDTRPAAKRATTVLGGPARLAYLALEAGSTSRGVKVALERASGSEAPSTDQIERWLDDWLDARLVMREGARYLALATNPNEHLPTPSGRLAALLA